MEVFQWKFMIRTGLSILHFGNVKITGLRKK